jgi:LuxR family maltose regulon positive regulatory protein
VLDDYHMLDSAEVDTALDFLIEHQPPQMHLIIMTREDPPLPLARLRARRQLVEIRAADLRFTPEEASAFLNHAMGLSLSSDVIDALERRTEGWIAGLQLAALSMQGHQDIRQFIEAFTGSHHFVLDYLVEEVLSRQSPEILDFLLQTSILDRMCGPLCDAILDEAGTASQSTLQQIHQANLFLIPLDNERGWYRYHHLFGDLLRKRLLQAENHDAKRLNLNASRWFEDNGYALEAFQHAAAAEDINRVLQLVDAGHTPLYLRGYAVPVLRWLQSLSSETKDARPILWVMTAWVLWITHQSIKVEPILQQAEAALAQLTPDDETDLVLGRVAAMRAMLAANTYQTDVMIAQSERALALLPDTQQYVRLEVKRTLASAHHIIGNRDEAVQAYLDTIALCEATDNGFTNILATTGLGIVYELETQLQMAEQAYERVLTLVGEPLQPIACEASLGLARLAYQRNDLDAAVHYGEQAILLAEQIEGIDTALAGEILLAQLRYAAGDTAAAMRALDAAWHTAHKNQFTTQIPKIAALRIKLCLQQGDIETAAALLAEHENPLSRARLELADGNTETALETLRDYHQEMAAKSWSDELLQVYVLQALASRRYGDNRAAMQAIQEAMTLAAPGGYIRVFVDEGQPMRQLLLEAAQAGIMPIYVNQLLEAFEAPDNRSRQVQPASEQSLIEPLSERELEVLHLVAEGLSNREISERLYISINTVKGHNRVIFEKLGVSRRTEAVARARELGILTDQ